MNGRLAKRLKYGAIGFAYGIVLAVFAFFAHYSGNGSMVPALLFSAPLGLFDCNIVDMVFLLPVLWIALGIALGGTGKRSFWLSIVLVGLHWLGAVYILVTGTDPGDWMHLQRVWLVATLRFLSVFGIYLAGQIAVVTVLLRRYQSQKVRHPQG